ncbi:uridine kinase [Tellurirhabdus bombi]|uniref:uridine kinase n=1 Tax=Tellurirhabdus bombi TaxID=2907205 RepID=UPI001F34A67B|nr:uridine kinase [Tellurirhabdus bombi]
MITKPFIVGITGGSASGKTSFLKGLLDAFSEDEVCLISQDNYYRPLSEIPLDPNGIENFDLPETIDHHRYAQHIEQLRAGHFVEQLEYTFNNPAATPQIITLKPAPIIVVEGIFVFHFKEIADQLDLKVFVAAKNKIKLDRRIRRDTEERGYDLELIKYQWENHVRPSYQKYIKPYKAEADVVIPNNQHYQKGLDVVIGYLKSKL